MILFRELKISISMKDVLEHYNLFDQLQLRGKSYHGVCPFCEAEEEQPSFSASTEKNCFNCFNPSCDAHGDIIDFVRLMEYIGKRQAGEFLANAFNIGKKPDSGNTGGELGNKKVTDNGNQEKITENVPLKFTLQNIDPKHEAVAKLGITEETAMAFGAGFFTGNSKQFKNHVVMPIHNGSGELVGYTGIDPNAENPEHIYPSTFCKESELFHGTWNTPPPFDTAHGIILVKYPLQALTVHSVGIPEVIAFMSPIISQEHVGVLAHMSGRRPKITLLMADDDDGTVETLTNLISFFYVRLVRFKAIDGALAEFSTNDVRSLLK